MILWDEIFESFYTKEGAFRCEETIEHYDDCQHDVADDAVVCFGNR